jgi:hypothetical protein
MSYRRPKSKSPASGTAPEGRPVSVTIFRGRLAFSTLAGCPGRLLPGGVVREGLHFDVLEVSVPRLRLALEVGLSSTVYYLIRDILPHDGTDLPELMVDSRPKVALALSDGDLYTTRPGRAGEELQRATRRTRGQPGGSGVPAAFPVSGGQRAHLGAHPLDVLRPWEEREREGACR